MDKEILEISKRLETKMDQGLGRIETKVDKLETKLDGHILILRALEYSAEVNKSEHDKMSII
jgi:hypothetical protein